MVQRELGPQHVENKEMMELSGSKRLRLGLLGESVRSPTKYHVRRAATAFRQVSVSPEGCGY